MNKQKKARRAEAQRKAKQKKIIITSVCSLLIIIMALVIIATFRSENNANANGITDFTRMSGTMVYAVLNDIYENPNDNIGTTIRARGRYQTFYDASVGLDFHYLELVGGVGCCGSMLEFRLDGDSNNYPGVGTMIEIVGTFSRRDDAGRSSFYWAAEDFVVVR